MLASAVLIEKGKLYGISPFLLFWLVFGEFHFAKIIGVHQRNITLPCEDSFGLCSVIALRAAGQIINKAQVQLRASCSLCATRGQNRVIDMAAFARTHGPAIWCTVSMVVCSLPTRSLIPR